MAKKGQVPAEPDREPRVQYAALPWRHGPEGEIQVLLITSRETRRWVIPKGWPIRGLKSARTAAQEAFEEAGVEGEIAKAKLGDYRYNKRLRSGRLQLVRVQVYALKVERELDVWPEQAQREKLWTSPDEAARLIEEQDLAILIASLSPA